MEQFDGSFRLAGTRESLDATFSVASGSLRVTAAGYEIGNWRLEDVRLTSAGDGIHILVEGEDLVVKMRDPGGFTEAVGEASPPRQLKKRRLLKKEKAQRTEHPADGTPMSWPGDDDDDDVSVSSVRLGQEQLMAPPPPPTPVALEEEPLYVPIQPTAKPAPPKQPLSKRVREARDIVEWKEWRRRLSIPGVRWGLAFLGAITVVLVAVFATGTLGMILTLIGMVSLILAALAVSDDPSVYRFLPARITETMLLAVGFVCLGLGLPLIFLA